MILLSSSGHATALSNPAATEAQTGDTLFINEYRVDGARKLPREAIEAAVYPFLGPGRTKDDVEQARAALEQAYTTEGFQTVTVLFPEQKPAQLKRGIIHLQVVERVVGRLRVKGAHYSSPKQIKAMAPSVAEGTVINFNQITPDIIALNQLPDRQVTPSLRPGVEPDTVDVDLEVKEKAPLHASVSLDNRQAPYTTPLRLTASVSDSNLFQAGQGAGLTFQTAPQKPSEVKVFSGYYLARFPAVDWLTVMINATKQDSNVSTLGNAAVTGRGSTVGIQMLCALPAEKDFTETASLGLDYKHMTQTIPTDVAPINYFPVSATYTADWQGKQGTTEINAGVTFSLRGVGSNSVAFNHSRFGASNFLYFHGDLSHTHELPGGWQLFGKVQGQLADRPLVSGEQISGGGIGTARGYLEGEEVGDDGLFGTVELRSPALLSKYTGKKGEWRLFAFTDAGWLKVIDSLTDQKNHFDFASYGIGSRWQLFEHFDGSLILSLPQLKEGQTKAHEARLSFQAGLNY